MRLWVQFLVLMAVVVILVDQNGVEAKKNKQKHGRSQERSPAKSGHKENSRKVRDVSNESGSKEKYNKKEQVKYTKQTKKNNKNEYKEKNNNEFVDKKPTKDKKQGKTTEYAETKKNDKKGKNKEEKVVKAVLKEEEEVVGVEEIIDENDEKMTDVITNEEAEVEETGGKEKEDKLVQCKKKTDSVETNMTETCEKYKTEKNMKVVEQTVIGEKTQATPMGACDACRS